MSRNITKIPIKPVLAQKKKVAAYARVSSGKDAMLHSLSAQITHYSALIQSHGEWQYVGVYADEAVTGTKAERHDFQRLLEDCRTGKIDLVITKSISRFARNTVTLLETVRELKAIGVDVYFEEQNIHTLSNDGELMLTILASYAQEESLSVSENCKWMIRNRFKDGIPTSFSIIGYDLKNGVLEIIPNEAKLVKMIFFDYLSGMGRNAIVKKLNSLGFKTKKGNPWSEKAIDRILRNEKYIGDLELQKVYSSNHIEKKKCINKGQLPKYYVNDSHEPIIDRNTFENVQSEIQKRAERFQPPKPTLEKYSFTGKIICGKCKKHYHRKRNNANVKSPVWICSTYKYSGKTACSSSQMIPEDVLLKTSAEVLDILEFDSVVFERQIKEIQVFEKNKLLYIFYNNKVIEKTWQNKSRKESWTEEMKQAAREKAYERRCSKCQV
jgi:DNA invertase Pin-like site-specific DNA recombinase